jgi:catecholate siderophore receptor
MSSHIRARKHKANQLATLVTLAFPAAALAQQAVTLPEVKVEAKAESYKADRLSSSKQTQPILDIPQVVNVVKKELLLDQGATTLMEALRNTPGITQQLGENGNTAAGDTFQMRGFSTQASTFVDGVRDLGAVTRDVFNLEQVEVVKGPSGGDIGRGASSGYINLVTKQANLENSTSGTLGWNTGNNTRATVDLNRKVGDTSAFRLNAMAQGGGVDGRNEVENKGFAIAPSFATGLGTPTRVYLSGQFVRQDNVPDGGISTIGMPGFYPNTNGTQNAAQRALTAGARVDRENFYGNSSDYEKVTADMVTAKVEHDFGNGTTLRNTTRWGRTNMDRLLSSPGGLTATTIADPSTWTTSISRQRIDQTNEILANLTSLTTELNLGGMKHSLAYGFELMRESQDTPTYAFVPSASFPQNLYAPSMSAAMPAPPLTPGYTNGKTTTVSAYFFDTIEVSKNWLLNGGIRVDDYKTETNAVTRVTGPSGNNPGNIGYFPGYAAGDYAPTSKSDSDTLVSWKLGAVYKPVSNGSIYAATANSYLPPGGSNFALSATGGINTPGFKPQQTRSVELGTKWDVLNKRLSLSAATYRTTAKNELALEDPLDPTSFAPGGEREVKGFELGAVGQLTENWQVSAGVATMDTKIKSGSVRENANASTTATGVATRWSPDLTATLWTSYSLGKWTFGGGARYMSEQKRIVDPTIDLSTQNMPSIPSYAVYDAMISYKVDKNVTLRLNVYNLTDKFYINTLNNNGNRMTLGLPRSATLTAQFQF